MKFFVFFFILGTVFGHLTAEEHMSRVAQKEVQENGRSLTKKDVYHFSAELIGPVSAHIPIHVFQAYEHNLAAVEVELHIRGLGQEKVFLSLGLGDQEGRWFSCGGDKAIGDGSHKLTFACNLTDQVRPLGHGQSWNAYTRSLSKHIQLFSSTSMHGSYEIRGTARFIRDSVFLSTQKNTKPDIYLLKHFPEVAQSGQRLEADFQVSPFPFQPYDTDTFSLRLRVQRRGNEAPQEFMGYYMQPYELSNRGDMQEAIPQQPGFFRVRWRPRRAGDYDLHMQVYIDNRLVEERALGAVTIQGADWDDYIYIDEKDKRFFRKGDGSFYWPLGINLRSVWDVRGKERTTQKRLTPDLGSISYEAYLRRLSARGVNAVEIWMSSWNLALEWRRGWPNYQGLGRYNQVHAQRLDEILDLAYELNIRINLVVHNHGMASARVDAEWNNSPYNVLQGGMLKDNKHFWTDKQALYYQDRLRGYLLARYGDHPAILGWKLWSEMDLTGSNRDDRVNWHRRALADYHKRDPYNRIRTSHWSGNYRKVDGKVVTLPYFDYICIDAYHSRRRTGETHLFAQLAYDSWHHDRQGLKTYNKPVLITEFGGSWNAGPDPQIIAEHRQGPWAAMVSGLAASPMLWWFEWVDQHEHYQPYQALSQFLISEDLRGKDAKSIWMTHESQRRMWSRAWVRPGRVLGYVLDYEWGYDGLVDQEIADLKILVSHKAKAGAIIVEWWNAENGVRESREVMHHAGGALWLQAPAFRRHIAYKVIRK